MNRLTKEINHRFGVVVQNLNVGDTIGKSTLEELQNIYDELFDTDASLMIPPFDETVIDKINETLERLEECGSGEVFDFVFPLMETIKGVVEKLEEELIKPTRWVSMEDLIKWFINLMGDTFD